MGPVLARFPIYKDRITCAVINAGPALLADVTVTVYDLTYRAEMLSPGGRFSFQFDPGPEGHYQVTTTAIDGHQITRNLGYFSSGISAVDTVLVSPSGITLAPAGSPADAS